MSHTAQLVALNSTRTMPSSRWLVLQGTAYPRRAEIEGHRAEPSSGTKSAVSNPKATGLCRCELKGSTMPTRQKPFFLSQQVLTFWQNVFGIAAIHGPAGLAARVACDLRVAGHWPLFCQRSRLANPSAGGCSPSGGPTRAKPSYSATVVSAEALAWGLVNRLVDDPHQNAHAWAEQSYHGTQMPSEW